MTSTIEVQEYALSQAVQLNRTDLAMLQAVPSDRLQVVPTVEAGWFTVRATSYVGTVDLDSVRIRITPKVQDLRNVLMMFAATAGAADWSPRTSDYAQDDLVEGVAALVLRTIDQATRRGLVHGYRTQEEGLATVRGRIMVGELARRPWDQWPTPCRYDEFTADVPENRVLLAAVLAIRRWTLAPELRRLATELEARFIEVSAATAPLDEADLVRRTPLNEHYQPALALARTVLESLGVTPADGDVSGVSFLVDMNRLFELWVGAELTERLWPDLRVDEQESVPLSRNPTVRMNPDLIFRDRGQVVLVGDVKYKLSDSGFARNADYYQLLAYATACDVESGILIYCQADGAPPRTIRVAHGDQRLTCYPLPLAGDWEQVSRGVDQLARSIRAVVSR